MVVVGCRKRIKIKINDGILDVLVELGGFSQNFKQKKKQLLVDYCKCCCLWEWLDEREKKFFRQKNCTQNKHTDTQQAKTESEKFSNQINQFVKFFKKKLPIRYGCKKIKLKITNCFLFRTNITRMNQWMNVKHTKKRESSRKATTTYATTQDNKHHRCNTRMNH